MGFFSWRTQDTDKSISNAYSENGTFPVFMIDDKGNIWYEDEYEGYGEFGGKDYYELLAVIMRAFLKRIDWVYDYNVVYFLYSPLHRDRYHHYMFKKWGEKYCTQEEYDEHFRSE